MLWFAAMLCLFRYMQEGEMMRVWIASFAAGLIGVSVWNPSLYFAIDAVTAALIIWKGPRHESRQFIALCFTCMAAIDLLLIFNPGHGVETKVSAMIAIGWAIVIAFIWWRFPPSFAMPSRDQRSPMETRHEGT